MEQLLATLGAEDGLTRKQLGPNPHEVWHDESQSLNYWIAREQNGQGVIAYPCPYQDNVGWAPPTERGIRAILV